MNGPALEVTELRARRGATDALRGVGLRVERGTLHALVGPNGSGKSTLLRCVLGLEAFEGRVRVDGAVGYVPQVFAPEAALALTVRDFLGLTRSARPVCLGLSPAARARAAAALALLGLDGLEERALQALSGGELRRLLVADALERRPELLLLDEPWAGVDASSGARLESALRAFRAEGRTALFVTHDAAQAERLADAVTRLEGGCVVG